MKVNNVFKSTVQIIIYNLICVGLATISMSSMAQQYCNGNIKKTTPNERFEVLAQNNGSEVLDKKTNLIWQRCSLGQSWNGTSCIGSAIEYNWNDALVQAKALGKGYRIPNIQELRSIIEESCAEPSVNAEIFPNMPNIAYYRSSTPNLGVDFLYGVDTTRYEMVKSKLHFVRAVRANPNQ